MSDQFSRVVFSHMWQLNEMVHTNWWTYSLPGIYTSLINLPLQWGLCNSFKLMINPPQTSDSSEGSEVAAGKGWVRKSLYMRELERQGLAGKGASPSPSHGSSAAPPPPAAMPPHDPNISALGECCQVVYHEDITYGLFVVILVVDDMWPTYLGSEKWMSLPGIVSCPLC